MVAKVKIKRGKSRDLEGEFLAAWRGRHGNKHEPIDQLKFAKRVGRLWRFDMSWPGSMVAVEIDGAVFVRGRHSRGIGQTNDNQKLNAAQLLGWRVFRFTVKDFEAGAIEQMLDIVTLAVLRANRSAVHAGLFPVRKAAKKQKKTAKSRDPRIGYGVNLAALGIGRKK